MGQACEARARRNQETVIEVKLVDAKGVQCLDARNFVRFALAGDGELIDNLGTSATARKVQLYNGRAQIKIRETGPLSYKRFFGGTINAHS